jgi:hypothetical protein
MSDETEAEDPIPEIHVITLIVNTDKHAPELDIGDMPPQSAITFLRQAAETLEEILHPPKVTYRGETVFEVICAHEDDDEN